MGVVQETAHDLLHEFLSVIIYVRAVLFRFNFIGLFAVSNRVWLVGAVLLSSWWTVCVAQQLFVYIFWHGDINILILVMPIQGNAAV